MSAWEASGKSDEWYTPRYIFDALGVTFDMDVAAPKDGPRYVPTKSWISSESLQSPWVGFIWMNPPFGGRNALEPWLEKFFAHGNGISLTPDRTSAPWWQDASSRADSILMMRGKPKFERPDGSIGKSPSHGVTLWAAGYKASVTLQSAKSLGSVFRRVA